MLLRLNRWPVKRPSRLTSVSPLIFPAIEEIRVGIEQFDMLGLACLTAERFERRFIQQDSPGGKRHINSFFFKALHDSFAKLALDGILVHKASHLNVKRKIERGGPKTRDETNGGFGIGQKAVQPVFGRLTSDFKQNPLYAI